VIKLIRKPDQDDAPKTPAWIVSFTDMVTLLLAFFVLLQALSKTRDPELFRQGQGAFRRAIAGLGIPQLLFGRRQVLEGPSSKKKHPTEESPKPSRQRLLDVENERIQQAFHELKQEIDTETSDARRRVLSEIPTPVRFAASTWRLTDEARAYLARQAVAVRQNVEGDGVTVCVIGRSPDAGAGAAACLLSARRASAAARCFREALRPPDHRRWEVLSWGEAPDAGPSAGRDRAPGSLYIRIVILAGD
jgi:flagellar motor protein MotB